MTKCKSCGVLVDNALSHCPLCRRRFDIKTDGFGNEWYPQYEMGRQNPEADKYSTSIIKTTIFTALVACCVLTLINAFIITGGLWCVSFIIPTIYVAFTITHTFCSRAHLGLKILFQVVAISGLLLAVDIQSGFTRWSVNYSLPFLIIVGILLMGIIMSAKKIYFREFVEFIIALMILSQLPIHLYIYGVSKIIWPTILAEISAILTLVGLFMFSRNDFINEVKRRFHF